MSAVGPIGAGPLCVNAKNLDSGNFIRGAEVGGTVQLWQWIGDGATTFSY